MNEGLNHKCRACLALDEEMISFDEKVILIFNDLTNLEVKSNDGLPQHVCKSCWDIIELFVQFRERCMSVNWSLRNNLKNLEPLASTVKTEIECIIEPKDELDDTTYEDFVDSPLEVVNENFLDQVIEAGIQHEKVIKNAKKKKRKVTKLNPKIKSLPKQLTCGLCPEYFCQKKEKEFTEHLELHKKDNKCKICSAVFGDWYKLFAHRLVHLPSNERKCYICQRKFRAEYCLEFHYKKDHSNEKNVSIQCTACLKTFTNVVRLRKHTNELHSGKLFVCDYCRRVFQYKDLLRIHILGKHLNNKQYKCSLCDFTANFKNNLTVRCKFCSRVCRDQKHYDKHKCPMVKPTRMCPVCGKLIQGNRKNLVTHMRSHSDTLEFKCSRCPAAYKTPGALRVHTDKHDNNPRHRCEFCQRRFYHASVLLKHRRVHTGIKPYVCKICSKAFTGQHNLKVHMRVHGEDLINKKRIIADPRELIVNNGIRFYK
ncbi:zinc finger protein 664-like isoform X2 [Leptidea sinapis]|uniref:zinc finger protein 664-like isoform X2 n=1 Tax=Leptidea sinapis TaxID=189913 RepID=UPI0021C3442B|nr:zinc finger protein 664-like isoform X2 [Leptidea sinapis]